jgi:hypothetical protein
MRERLRLVEEHQIDRARRGFGFQLGKALAARLDRRALLPSFEGVARPWAFSPRT